MDLVPIRTKHYQQEVQQGGKLRPPPAFVQRLREYDRELLIGFSAASGQKEPLGRWIIARKRRLGRGIAHILTVETPDGRYLPLGDHVIQTLRKIDSWRIGPDELNRRLDAIFVQEAQARAKRIREPLLAGIDKLAWATRKSFDGYNLAHVDKEAIRAHERRVEARRHRLATR